MDGLRIVAAVAVILSHSFPLTGHHDLFRMSFGHYRVDLGGLAVATFFIISGFLITMSWTSTPRPLPYVVKRFARIWPAFAMVVLASALLLGPGLTTLSVRDYLSSEATWSYVGHNLFMAPITYLLPGVFSSQPISAVNGSLWTLPYEVLAYVGVLLLGVLGLLTRRVAMCLALATVFAVFRLGVVSHSIDLTWLHAGGINFWRLLGLMVWFLSGSVLWLFRGSMPWGLPLAALATVAVVVGSSLGESALFMAGLAYLIIYVGTRQWHRMEYVRRLGDPSYGTYLYAWPIQQTLVHAGVHSAWSLFLAATPIAIVCGFVSWHLVERPSMRALGRFARRSDHRRAETYPAPHS